MLFHIHLFSVSVSTLHYVLQASAAPARWARGRVSTPLESPAQCATRHARVGTQCCLCRERSAVWDAAVRWGSSWRRSFSLRRRNTVNSHEWARNIALKRLHIAFKALRFQAHCSLKDCICVIARVGGCTLARYLHQLLSEVNMCFR